MLLKYFHSFLQHDVTTNKKKIFILLGIFKEQQKHQFEQEEMCLKVRLENIIFFSSCI